MMPMQPLLQINIEMLWSGEYTGTGRRALDLARWCVAHTSLCWIWQCHWPLKWSAQWHASTFQDTTTPVPLHQDGNISSSSKMQAGCISYLTYHSGLSDAGACGYAFSDHVPSGIAWSCEHLMGDSVHPAVQSLPSGGGIGVTMPVRMQHM